MSMSFGLVRSGTSKPMRLPILISVTLVQYALTASGQLARHGDEFLVNDMAVVEPLNAGILPLLGGRALIVWDARASDGQFGVFGRIIDDKGAPAGASFRISSGGPGDTVRGAVSPGGNVLVVWGSPARIVGQRFDGTGEFVGAEFVISDPDLSAEDPSVVSIGHEGFLVLWGGPVPGHAGSSLTAR